MTSSLDTVQAWASAERSGDAAALEAVLHQEFLGVGPFGFVLDREQWTDRYRSGDLQHRSFTFTPDMDPRRFGGVAIVVGTQEQQGTHQGRPIDGAFRVSLVLVGEADWRVAAIHLSLRNPPGASGAPGPQGPEGRPS
jgi:hypothetical protein